MKKTIILSAVFVVALAVTSCNKSRTCTCNTTYDKTVTVTANSGGASVTTTDPQTSGTEISVVEDKISKKDGRRKYGCVDRNSEEVTVSSSGSGSSGSVSTKTETKKSTCTLK